MDETLYSRIVSRSGGQCEAEVDLQGWARCHRSATDVHHMLPKSRGGRILDQHGETAHLIHLCRAHHSQAHKRSQAEGLMIDGYVTTDPLTNNPVYTGSDEVLSKYSRGT